MKTLVLLALISATPGLAQKVMDKDRPGGSPITIEAKRIENRIKRELKSKLTFYVERMDPDYIHPDVQPMYKDMLARNLEKAIDDSQWVTDGECWEQLGEPDGDRPAGKRKVPALALEKRIGGPICMDPVMISEMGKGDMIYLVELAFHEHGHNFGYGEDDSNALAAEIGDTFDEEKMASPNYIPTPKFLPAFIKRNSRKELCLTSKNVEVALVFPRKEGWDASIGYGGTKLAAYNPYRNGESTSKTLKAHVIAENPVGNSIIVWQWNLHGSEAETVTLVITDTATKIRYVQKFEKKNELNLIDVPLDGNCDY